MNFNLSSDDASDTHYFCYNCYCSFNVATAQGQCPICYAGQLAVQTPVQHEQLKEPHINLAYIEGSFIWWDEISLLNDTPIVTCVKLPENVGFIPRYLFDLEDKVFIDPTDMVPINYNRPMKAAD